MSRRIASQQPVLLFKVENRSSADSELLDGVRAGDSAALQGIIDRYWDRLVEFAARLSGCRDTAADIAQRALIRLWERRESWRAGSEPKLILYTLVRHEAFNQMKSDRARLRRTTRSRPLQQSVPTPAEDFAEAELIRVLNHAIDSLSSRRREALILARFHDMKHAEIAELMGLTPRTVTNHISTALGELEAALRTYNEG
jgi:RNA polymerase sigma-70 factor, ECF subfamily